jgi:hypothetical protein
MHSISNRNFEIHIFALLTFREKFQDVTPLKKKKPAGAHCVRAGAMIHCRA